MDPSHGLALEYSERAEAYARHWSPVIRPMALPLLPALPWESAGRVLDVGTGTGALWDDVAAAARGARLVGVDRAEGMLRFGRAPRGRVAVMDAQRLGVRLGSIDVALTVFALFHFPDPGRALREILAVLAPRGALGLAVWGDDPALPGAAIWTEELDRAGAAPDPRNPSVMRQALMDSPEKLSGLLVDAGYDSPRVWARRFLHQWNAEELMQTQSRCGLPSRRLQSLTPGARRTCVDRVWARLALLKPPELGYAPEVIFGVALRPA